MFSIEKIKLRSRILKDSFFYHWFFWTAAIVFYVFITQDRTVFAEYYKKFDVKSIFLVVLFSAAIVGLVFTLIDSIFIDKLLRNTPFNIFTIFRYVLYILIGITIFVIYKNNPSTIEHAAKLKEITKIFTRYDFDLLRFIIIFFLACYINNVFHQTIKLVGRDNYNTWISGALNKPIEKELIFMFIDLTDYTTISEKLQHRKLSYLMQDVFSDMAIIHNYKGDIYNYLGDAAIITWDLKNGLHNNNCLKAFYAYKKLIERRTKYYQKRYGLVPGFKAGIHVGKVMVLQVGTIRRDISINGDALNTTARIESKCNEYKQELLISGDLQYLITNKKGYKFEKIGDINLKGKERAVDIYYVNQGQING